MLNDDTQSFFEDLGIQSADLACPAERRITEMKDFLRNLFRFVLQPIESGDEPYVYKPLNRKVLIAVGVLFCVLGTVATWLAVEHGGLAYALPVVVFFGAGGLCLVVGLLGSDRAVARIWGNR